MHFFELKMWQHCLSVYVLTRGVVILGNLNADILNLFLQHFSRRLLGLLANPDSLFSYTL